MADNKKPIDKEYLIASLKDFDKEILSKKYAEAGNEGQGTSDGIKNIDEIITKLNEKDYLKGLATETKVAEEIETHTETMKDIIRDGYQTILDESVPYFTGTVMMNNTIPLNRKLTFTNAVQLSNNKINIDSDGYVELKAGHIYFIHSNIMVYGNNNDVGYHIVDKNGDPLKSNIIHYAENGSYTDAIYPIVYETKENCAICIEISNSSIPHIYQYSITIYEIKQPVYTNVDISSFIEKIGDTSEDTPVGHIIPFMGNNAPAHYLICDGSEYNIDDYKDLANHFISEFGTANHFGGDGITTFAVPDLRGEFLRGTGTATRDMGSGADVGEHQDPTGLLNVSHGGDGSFVGGTGNTTLVSSNIDKSLRKDNHRWYFYLNKALSNAAGVWCGNDTIISTRPTNTSITWCIKAEHTYFVKFEDAKLYSEQERVIGKWINNKLLYQKVITFNDAFNTTGVRSLPHGISNIEFIYIKDLIIADPTSGNGRSMLGSLSGILDGIEVNNTNIDFSVKPSSKPYNLIVILNYTKK